MDKILQTLESGEAVILPTETVYGLFAKALDEAAVNNVYKLKKRPRDKALNLNVADLATIYAYSKEQPAFLEKLYQSFLPGPLTIILKANDKVPFWINSGMETVGFRVPAYTPTLDIIGKSGILIGPSANISGTASGQIFKEIQAEFQENLLGIEDDAALTGLDSTILDVSGKKARILRQGAITKEMLLEKVPELEF
ncbi:translation factor (SUA5) [Streptococcus varani]|uniref:L-threonylcarbamoyladenylate synthase n=1 Tax=Streptococcus varani TaxID=1608583 RepID=A0A0E3WEV6_9STRE|nr:L-threonylcarbamoyladenylate synthase [Streptococcus varani]CQR24381.1 translation factor (SUA5) [Streptococcus varani]